MTQEILRDKVTNFATALSLALYDRKLEIENIPLVVFYDTDVVLNAITGFESDSYIGRRTALPERLVRALLSCGCLGNVYMVRPHAFELDQKLRQLQRYKKPAQRRVFAERAKDYMRRRGIEKHMKQLLEIVERREGKRPERIEDFLGVLRGTAAETFIAIEMINGSWLQRCRRFFDKLLKYDHLGPEMNELMDDHGDVVFEIDKDLKKTRKDVPLNVFQDAAALTILSDFVSARDRGETDIVIRFYTETRDLVKDAMRNDNVRNRLSYKTRLMDDVRTPLGSEHIIRGPSYFLMRAWFTELSVGANRGDISKFDRLSDDLQELIGYDEQRFETALRSMQFEQRNMLDLINDFEQLALMDSIWVKGRIHLPDEDSEGWIAGWTDVFRFARGSDTGRAVFRRIDDVRARLETEVSRIRVWTDDFESTQRAIHYRRNEIKGDLEDPMRDLGLIRWGYDLTPEEVEHVVGMVKPLLKESDTDIASLAADIASKLETAQHDIRDTLTMSAVLWALGRYDRIISLVAECFKSSRRKRPASLRVIQAAAEMKDLRLKTLEEKQERIDELWKLKLRLRGEQRTSILLGVGYVLYHAWRQELYSKIQEVSVSAQVEQWAVMSYKCGEEAYDSLPDQSLAWAFSINHCAYVGITTGLHPERTQKYFDRLLRLHNFHEVWNCRFDDTVGCRYLVEIEKEWSDTRPEGRVYLDLKERIILAEDYFKRARVQYFGDIDLDEHEQRLYNLKHLYQTVKRTGGEERK
jgi:hypothetical protein